MTLAELLSAAGLPASLGAGDVPVAQVTDDSRTAGPGSVFVAVPGLHVDGADFAAEACARGAVAVVAARTPPGVAAAVPVVLVDQPAAALARLAAAAAGHPSRRMTVAGVTGTDGKTTTTTMLHAAWRGAGIAAAALTTVDFRSRDGVEPNPTRMTTLGAVELQTRLAAMLDAGIDHLALETSSHALAQHRVDAVDVEVGVFTRVSSEHLDYHGSWDEYLAAKLRLAEMVAGHRRGLLVGDADDRRVALLLAAVSAPRHLTYSAAGAPGADLVAEAVRAEPGGLRLTARTPWGEAPVHLRLAGRFNASNALAALAAACSTGASLADAVAGLERLDRVTGRMERVDLGQPFEVVVDYAHTADALARVLTELRAATRGRLWVVFGSAGERDLVKRPAMGEVAARLADAVVLTDEDPRSEDRAAILEDIARGARGAGGRDADGLWLIPDRAAAIAFAVAGAAGGDTVLLAGKGHETSMLTAAGAVPWDERRAAEAAIRDRLAREGSAS